MLIVIQAVAILIMLLGFTFILNPQILKRLMVFLRQGKRLYGIGVLRILLGVILLLGASQARLVGVVVSLGILFLLAGVVVFSLGPEKLKSILDGWDKKSTFTLRLMGLLILTLGILLVYAA